MGAMENMEMVAVNFNQQAEIHLAAGRLNEAVTACEAALKIQPNFAPAYNTQAKALQAQGKVEAAKECYEKALALSPEYAEAYANFGSLCVQQQKWQEAVAYYQKAISFAPNFAGAYRNLARIWTQLGKKEAAAECWYQALTLEPNWATAEEHLNLGNTLVEQEKFEQAIICYQLAIELNPKLAFAYHNLGEVFASKNQWQEAREYYRQSIEIDANSSWSYYGLGKTLVNLGEMEAAIVCYRKTIELAPTQANAYQSLAEALEKTEQLESAAIIYQKAIELNPDFYFLHHNLGCVLSKLERWNETLAPYRRALQLNPDFFWSYYNLGYALNQLERWEEAVVAYRQGIALKADFFWLHNNVGYALLELERWEESAAAYLKAIELNENFFWSQYKLGDALSHLQQWDRAISAYLNAITIQPDMLEVYKHLGNVLRQRAKSGLEAAILYYCQAIEVNQETGKVSHNILKIKSDRPDFYRHLGGELLKQNKFEGAIIFSRMALQIEPENPEISLQLEQAWSKKQQLDLELESYRRNIELEPNTPVHYSRLGHCLVELGDLDEAIACHHQASELRGWFFCAARGYQFTQDWFTHNIVVWQYYLQDLANKPGINVVEIGSFQGMSTCWLLDHILTQPTARITCIDWHFQKQYHPNIEKTEAAYKVTKFQGKSQEILPTLAADAYDLAYIDGCHKATSVLEDTLLSWKLVKLGGLIIFDDYEWFEPETNVQVTKIGIDTFLSVFENQIEVLHKSYQLIVKKISNQGDKDSGKPEDKAMWVQAYQSLGDVLAQRQLEGVEICYQKAIEIQPNRGVIYHKLAKFWQDQEKFELAADAYSRAVEKDSKISWSYHNLGDVLLKLEKWEDAAIAYRQAIELNPDFHWSYNNLGTALTAQEKWDEAIPAYRRAIELNPDFFGSHHHLGNALIKQGKWEEAAAACLVAIKLNPDFSWTYQILGDLLIQQKKWEEAAAAYRRVVELNPEVSWCCQSLGEILEKQEKWEEAKAAYQRGKELEPERAWWCKKLGDVLQKQGLWDEAMATYQLGIEIDSRAYFCYEGLGLCELEKQNLEGAMADFIQALQIKPDFSFEIYDKIGNILEQQGQIDGVLGCYINKELPLNVIAKFSQLPEDWEVTSESDSSITHISIHPASQLNLLPSTGIDNQSIFQPHPIDSPPAFVALVPEGRAWGDAITTAVITSEGKLVTDISTRGNSVLVLSSNKLPPAEYINGKVVLLSAKWGGLGYFHWMFDVVARIGLLRDIGINLEEIDKFVVNSYRKSYEIETLTTLGISPSKIIDSSLCPHIQAKSLIVPSLPYQGAYRRTKWACEFLKKEFLGDLNSKKGDHGERIYISRDQVAYRRVVNEEEVLRCLEKFGFKSVKLETMSVAEQASCLAAAKIVVAPHGAGLTNLLFCSSGTKVIEIFSPMYVLEDYLILTSVCNLEHYSLIGDSFDESDSGSPVHKDIKINLESLEKLIFTFELTPNLDFDYHKLGDTYRHQEKWEDAATAYRQAIELNPDFCWSYNSLGNVLMQLSRWEEAAAAYRRVIELNPDFCWSYNSLGNVLMQLSRWEEAAAVYRRTIELNPDFCWSYNSLGEALVKISEWDEAAAAYRRSIVLNPDFCWSYYSLGEILEKQEKWEEAAASYRRSVELKSDSAWLCKKLGDVLQKQGLWDEAMATYQLGIEVDAQASFCYEGLGLCRLAKQDWEGAIADFIQALQIQPCLLEAYHKIGYALEQQGELEKSEYQCCECEMLPLKVLKKYCGFSEDLTVKSEFDPSINHIKISPINELSVLPSKSLDSNNVFSGLQYYLPETFVAVIPEGRTWSDVITSAVITSENKLVTDLSTGCTELVISSDKLSPVEYIDGNVAFLSVRWGGGSYYHWMFDVIPRFDLLRRSGIDIETIDKFIVNGIDHAYEKETLKILGIPESKIIESRCGLHIKAKKLIVPSKSYQGISQISTCEFIRKEFLPEKCTQKIDKFKRIYISRERAKSRQLINEAEVFNFLEQWGFENVKLETMSVTEQASCLASAEIVVAPHGAGLTNLAFCNPGTKVIEIFSPSYLASCYWILSNACGLDHYYLIGDLLENSDSRLPIHQDIKLDLDLLEKLIQTYDII
jgi:tetratricopeptide (TPR) repeat protein